jgi:hypothetical protein
MRRSTLCAVAASLTLLLAGCATDTTQFYHPPAGLNPTTAATIVGSKNETALVLEDQRIVLSSVDGGVTRVGKHSWDQPILVPPGRRVLGLMFMQGSLFGQIAGPATLEAGKTYVVRAQTTGDRVAMLWLEEQDTRAPVGEKLATRLIAGGGATFVPIFIPRR